ncbi:16593_t:CDS:1, partial [Dentiscutata erythropus]
LGAATVTKTITAETKIPKRSSTNIHKAQNNVLYPYDENWIKKEEDPTTTSVRQRLVILVQKILLPQV